MDLELGPIPTEELVECGMCNTKFNLEEGEGRKVIVVGSLSLLYENGEVYFCNACEEINCE